MISFSQAPPAGIVIEGRAPGTRVIDLQTAQGSRRRQICLLTGWQSATGGDGRLFRRIHEAIQPPYPF